MASKNTDTVTGTRPKRNQNAQPNETQEYDIAEGQTDGSAGQNSPQNGGGAIRQDASQSAFVDLGLMGRHFVEMQSKYTGPAGPMDDPRTFVRGPTFKEWSTSIKNQIQFRNITQEQDKILYAKNSIQSGKGIASYMLSLGNIELSEASTLSDFLRNLAIATGDAKTEQSELDPRIAKLKYDAMVWYPGIDICRFGFIKESLLRSFHEACALQGVVSTKDKIRVMIAADLLGTLPARAYDSFCPFEVISVSDTIKLLQDEISRKHYDPVRNKEITLLDDEKVKVYKQYLPDFKPPSTNIVASIRRHKNQHDRPRSKDTRYNFNERRRPQTQNRDTSEGSWRKRSKSPSRRYQEDRRNPDTAEHKKKPAQNYSPERDRSATCHECKKRGHFMHNCYLYLDKTRARCKLCREKGHGSATCRKANASKKIHNTASIQDNTVRDPWSRYIDIEADIPEDSWGSVSMVSGSNNKKNKIPPKPGVPQPIERPTQKQSPSKEHSPNVQAFGIPPSPPINANRSKRKVRLFDEENIVPEPDKGTATYKNNTEHKTKSSQPTIDKNISDNKEKYLKEGKTTTCTDAINTTIEEIDSSDEDMELATNTVACEVEIPTLQTSGSRAFIKGMIDDAPTVFLLDTGSDVNIIDLSFIKAHPHIKVIEDDENVENMSLTCATGKKLKVIGKCITTVTISNQNTHNIEFIVVDKDSININAVALLGRSGMGELCLRDLPEKRKIYMRIRDESPEEDNETNTIRVHGEQIIPGRSIQSIQIEKVLPKNKLLFTDGDSIEVGIDVMPCILDNTSNEILCINYSNFPRKLPTGKKLTEAKLAIRASDELNTSDTQVCTIHPNTAKDVRQNIEKELGEIDFHEHSERLIQLLVKYRKAISLKGDPPGRTDLVEHSIEVREGSKPPSSSAYRIPHSLKQPVRNEINKLIKDNRVVPCKSNYASPIICVKKKDGSLRLCVDYRSLNNITTKDLFTLPNISDIIQDLRGSLVFSCLDMKSGFYQIPMRAEDIHKTAFVTNDGMYAFKCMPFGLCNAPASYQRLMSQLFRGMGELGVSAYMDDILVASPTIDKHFKTLDKVFDILEKNGLTLHFKKSTFLRRKTLYLGHIIGPEGIEVDQSKTKILQNYPPPKTPKQVRSFLGTTNYFRNHILNYSILARPLINLTKKTKNFHWTDECQTAFNKLKDAVHNAPLIHYPNFSIPFLVITDASTTGIAGCLAQISDNQLKIIEYYSKTLGSCAARYGATKLELLGVSYSLQKFKFIILNYEVMVLTDHKPLLDLIKKSNIEHHDGMIVRNILKIQSFSPQLRYIPGKENNLADYLSRINVLINKNKFQMDKLSLDKISSSVMLAPIEAKPVMNWTHQEMVTAQRNDGFCQKIRYYLEQKKEIPNKNNLARKQYIILDDLVYVVDPSRGDYENERYRLVIPKALSVIAVQLIHDTAASGHAGVERTKHLFNSRFFFPNSSKLISDYVKSCSLCQLYKGSLPPPASLNHYPIGRLPFEAIHMDTSGPYNTSNSGMKYIIVFRDRFTRFTILCPTKDRTSEEVARSLLYSVILPYSAPKVIISDQAKEFLSNVFKSLCKSYSIKTANIVSYHPSSNGLVERSMSILGPILRIMTHNNKNDWDKYVPFVESSINTAYCASINDSPFYCLYGYDKRLPSDIITEHFYFQDDLRREYISLLRYKHSEILHCVRMTLIQNSLLYSSKPKTKDRTFEIGDRVLVRALPSPVGSSKLCLKWQGPYRIEAILPYNKLALKDISFPDKKPRVVHTDRVKIYYQSDCFGETNIALEPFPSFQTNVPNIPLRPDNNSGQDHPGWGIIIGHNNNHQVQQKSVDNPLVDLTTPPAIRKSTRHKNPIIRYGKPIPY